MAALTQKLSGPKFDAMLEELRALSARPTLAQIAGVMVRYGVTSPTAKNGQPSIMAAKTLRDGPFKRYVERLNAGRETREALCSAAGAGVHPLDAIEEAMVLELQDHLIGAEGGEIDIKFVIDQLTKLRTAISMRENSRRQQTDLERKLADSESKRIATEERTVLLERRLELVQFDAAKAVLEHAKEVRLVIADKNLDGPAKTERVRKLLFGEKPADFKPVTGTGAKVE
ncbi:MAG: hypothetical protein HY302_09345 [Opitutae bacterium]|nr:hypothetical protein [Opitutae bacterium]